jgi:hypothetical protein
MAGNVVEDTGCMAGCGIAAQSATEPSANARDMENLRMGCHLRT